MNGMDAKEKGRKRAGKGEWCRARREENGKENAPTEKAASVEDG